MELLKALAMPFQPASLLFVGMTSLLLTLVLSVGGIAVMLAIPAMGLMAIWFTQFTFTLIDDAVNGKQETAAASAEMLSPWGDMRCWVHPMLTVFIAVALLLQPQIPRVPVLAACALLFPASIGAIALTGNALDALNPLALARVARGLAHYYLLAVLWLVFCVALGWLIAKSGLWMLVQIAAAQLLWLLVCAFMGGAIYTRRLELGFQPLVSPERAAEREQDNRGAERQRMIDAVFGEVRMRRPDGALTIVRRWLEGSAAHQLPGDVKALLSAGAGWSAQRSYLALLRGLAPLLLSMRQPALAFATVEAALAAAPGFTLEQEGDATSIIRYALQTGRKRLAATLLANFDSLHPESPGAERLALRAQLQQSPDSGGRPAS